jgi:transposase
MKTDARKLTTEAQQNIRYQAISLHEKGFSGVKITDLLGVSPPGVYRWVSAWKKGGKSALKMGSRGQTSAVKKRLSVAQEALLMKLICDKNPLQMELPFALWNRKAIKQVIWNLWSIRLALRTISDYTKRWGFTPQKPTKMAYDRNPKAVQKWLIEDYLLIKKRAKLLGGEVYWGGETGFRNDFQHSREYEPKVKTSVVTVTVKRFSSNMISAVNNRGTFRFMIYDKNMTARVLLRFFSRLINDAKGKVFLILDNLRVYHAELVKAWLKRHWDEMEVYYLPAYSPDLNPDEHLNCDLKAGIKAPPPARNKEQLKKLYRVICACCKINPLVLLSTLSTRQSLMQLNHICLPG